MKVYLAYILLFTVSCFTLGPMETVLLFCLGVLIGLLVALAMFIMDGE